MFALVFLCLVGKSLALTGCTAPYQAISGHTRCLDDNSDVDQDQSGLSDQDEIDMLKYHNDYRAAVVVENSAGAKLYPMDLMKLKWDDELAETAQKWANQCKGGHDGNDKRIEPNFSWKAIGQNAAGASGGKDLKSAVDGWYNEVNDFIWATNTSKSVGHFTVVAHNKMTRVGCGFAMCPSRLYKAITVCNYDNTNWLSTIFEPFTADTKADNRGGYCNKADLVGGLCAGACMNLNCQNEGEINIASCTCACPSGFVGVSCETKDCGGLENTAGDGCATWMADDGIWKSSMYKDFLTGSCALSMCTNPP